MVTSLQEVGRLVVLIQDFDLEVGKSWQGVSVVLLCLKGREKMMRKDKGCEVLVFNRKGIYDEKI